MIGMVFAPESPWWLIRKGRLEEAKASLLRLTSPSRVAFDADQAIALMVVTTENERQSGTGTRYQDCFQGVDRRRTSIACCCWGIQILSGTGLRVYSTYFYEQAGLPTEQAFNMSIVQYALGIIGVFVAWAALPRFGRRTLYLYGLAILAVILLVIGSLGAARTAVLLPSNTRNNHVSVSVSISWAIGSMLLAHTFIYDVTIGPVCYALVAEIPSVHLRSKSIVLARMTYNILNIVSNVLTPYMLNPSAWNWGSRTGYFYGGTCVLSLIYTYFCVPEPSGRTYAELGILFQKRTSARRFARTSVGLPAVREVDVDNHKDE